MEIQNSDRRRHERAPLDEGVYCYIDGSRFDTRSNDVSEGGLFLRTDAQIPVGGLIALVFRPEFNPDSPPIFLVGQVVRQQQTPVAGVGLQWVRAVTESPRLELAHFLVRKLGVKEPSVGLQEHGPNREMRSVFEFPLAPVPPEPIDKTSDQPDLAGASSLPEAPSAEQPGEAPGPMTATVTSTATPVAANLEALTVLDGKRQRCRIAGLNLERLLLHVQDKPDAYSESIPVIFTLPSKVGRIRSRVSAAR